MLKNLKQMGLTILVSTPYMNEAELCDRIALIQSGKILSVNTPEKLIHDYGETLYTVTGGNMYKLLNLLRDYDATESCFAFGNNLHLTLKNKSNKNTVVAYLQKEGFEDAVIQETIPGIEDCFIKLLKTN
jgi:ABC-type multidrug transport system ATPase subunit